MKYLSEMIHSRIILFLISNGLLLSLVSCEMEDVGLFRKLVGDDWVAQNTGTDERIDEIIFLDNRQGWALGYETLIRTKNGGETWEMLSLPTFFAGGTIHFFDAANGWINTISQGLLKTNNGGDTWSTVPLDSFIDQIFFLNALTAWAPTIDQTMLKTVDGWETWEEYEFDVVSTSFLQFVNAETGWALGYGINGSSIRRTDDGGLTWRNQFFNVQGGQTDFDEFQNAFFLDENTGWIIGNGYSSGNHTNSYLLKTTDGGQIWESQLLGSNSYPPLAQDIHFINSQTGYIVGSENERGIILKTTNGGESWTKEQLLTDKYLYCLYVSKEQEIWVGGDEGIMLYRPDDQ